MGVRSSQIEVLVIGGGMAGWAAARAAKAAGAEVMVVRKGYAATAMAPGAADFPDGYKYEDMEQQWLRDLAQVGVELVAAGEGRKWHVIDIWGQVHLADFVSSSSQGASLEELGKAKLVGLVELEGYADFHSWVVAEALRSQLRGSGELPEIKALGIVVPGLDSKASLTAAEIAQVLEEKDRAYALAQRVVQALGDHAFKDGAVTLLFPPVLGLRREREIQATIQQVTGARVAELLATLPSIPGFRWQQALDMQLGQEGIPVISGEVEALLPSDGNQGTLSGAWVQVEGRLEQVQFQAAVLATGGLVGGGLGGSDQTLLEPLASLPVFMGSQRVDGKPLRQLIQEGTHAQQALWRAGVRVDGFCRPVGEGRKPVYRNLFAAGALVQGAGLSDGGLGAAYVTGTWAGQEAARVVGGGKGDE